MYVGVSVIDYLGGHDVNTSDRALLYGIDRVRWPVLMRSHVVLRPVVGVGSAAVSHTDPNQAAMDVVTSASGAAASDTTTVHNVYVRPGATLLLDWPFFFVALRAEVLILPGISDGSTSASTTWFSYTLGGGAGLRF